MPKIKIESKLPSVGTSIFAVMSRMAGENNAINLSQGFPDFNCPADLTKLVEHYLKNGYNQYAPMPGIPKLRERISEKIKFLYGRIYDPSTEIIITAGATQALFTAISSLIQKDDEVIIFEPAYDAYIPDILANGGKPVPVQLTGESFSIDWNKVKDAISNKTKLIILNSPHNPSGSTLDESDIKNLEEITRDKNIFIISDEVYEHIVFDGNKHISLAGSPELSERTFVISSFGKTYHTTGWKMGYCAAPERMIDEFKKLHQFVVYAVNTPIQHAYADYLEKKEHYLSLGGFYQQKRDFILNKLKDSRFIFTPAKGTYFQLLDYSQISTQNDIYFAEYLTKQIGVAVIPLSPFYSAGNNRKLIRICFAKNENVLDNAAAKLRAV